MSTLEQNLTRLQTAKTAIANAITAKGGTVNQGDGFEDFPDDISSIPSGSSSIDPGTCLTFKGTASFTLKTKNTSKNWYGTLQYSKDGSTWSTWDGSAISSSSTSPYVLYLRGTGNTYLTGQSNSGKGFVFTTSGTIKCIGRIDTLLNYTTVKNGGTPTMGDYCYASLFSNNSSIVQAPELPATTLTSNCYVYMFSNTRLTSAPALPATTLASYCYYSMFSNCTSLTSAPALPATTLATYCYNNMFCGCTSLRYPPTLPATTLANYCYGYMFDGCSNLITCPRLPATTLIYGCYYYMFYNCKKLVNLPQIICTDTSSTAQQALASMFRGCSLIKLSTTESSTYDKKFVIKNEPSTLSSSSATFSDMFTSTGGSFTGTASYCTTYYTSNVIV